jgi:hypothetical protein
MEAPKKKKKERKRKEQERKLLYHFCVNIPRNVSQHTVEIPEH